ncbi:type II toxin-antitoxin system RelE/ParE family toxin [Ancylobacter radicis]|uniref:Type II toxin-antitoxin system RelE/ParE family toxin n=1 Tax=Ancylobacter radicis TaxID=2836179 RepID=A0ABS5RDE6_9HYPH|nr:type II toxin-antitoxin system RelE/ParE family toxin [Ancylobacter radicis]
MAYRVVFSPEASDDLLGLYLFIAQRSGPDIALGYVERIEVYCRSFADFPMRGTCRDDIRPGLRVVGFERRVTAAFHIDGDRVVFDRLLYGGRSLERLSGDD